MRAGILAEFEAPEPLLAALVELRRRGYGHLDAFTPYPLKEAEAALGLGRSPINWMVLPFWVASALAAYLLQWWCNAYDYPLDVAGRPPHSAPAFVPITFEMGVLGTAIFSILLLLLMAGLPALYHPVFDVAGFERASIDRFFLGVDAEDPNYDAERLIDELTSLGATRVSLAATRGR